MRDEEAILEAWSGSSQEGVIWFDLDRHIRKINRTALYLLDLQGTPQSWYDQPVWDLISVVRQTAPDFAESLRADAEGPDRNEHRGCEGRFDDGQRTVHWHTAPLVADPYTLGHLILLRDVTEARILREMRNDLNDLCSNRLQGHLEHLSTALRSLTDNLAPESAHDTASIDSLAHARDTTSAVLSALEEFIEISRLRSGELPLSPSAFSFSEIVASVLQTEQVLVASRDLTLEHHIADPLPMTWGDRNLIERVLRHLVTNALHVSAPGSNVAIEASTDSERRDKIKVSIGAPAHSTRAPDAPAGCESCSAYAAASGEAFCTGFKFCQAVLEAHGERLWVSPVSQTGTRVVFTLPQVSQTLHRIQATAHP